MKKTLMLLLLLIVTAIAIPSCSKSSNSSGGSTNPPGDNPNPGNQTFGAFISTGTWSITSYTQGTEDKTPLFTGYTFTFTSTGGITATTVSATINGTWTSDEYTDSYGYVYNANQYTINMGNTEPLQRLTRSWTLSRTTSSAQFTKVGAGEMGKVTFTRK